MFQQNKCLAEGCKKTSLSVFNYYGEIAEATGARTGTVKSRIHYARKRLRQLLED